MFDKIVNYFERENWFYTVSTKDSDKKIILLGMSTRSGNFHCFADINEKDQKVLFLSLFPIKVPEKLRGSASELLMRINYITFIGNFEMDFEEGEIRFKTTLMYEGTDVSLETVKHLIEGNIFAMDTYFDTLTAFITEKISLSEAINKLEEVQV